MVWEWLVMLWHGPVAFVAYSPSSAHFSVRGVMEREP